MVSILIPVSHTSKSCNPQYEHECECEHECEWECRFWLPPVKIFQRMMEPHLFTLLVTVSSEGIK